MPQNTRNPENITNSGSPEPEKMAESVLQLIRELVDELQPDFADAVRLDSNLDRDLGFDSLARSELILRTEHEFNVSLPDQTLAIIDTPRDLIRELLSVIMLREKSSVRPELTGSELIGTVVEQIRLDTVESLPEHVETLQQLLDWHVGIHPERPHLYVYQNADEVMSISYRSLRDKAQHIAAGLLAQGIEPGDCVAIMLPTSNDYFYTFFGILYARAIPVPIYPPARPSQIEDHLKRHASILNNAQTTLLITIEQAKPLSRLLKMQVPSVKAVVTVSDFNPSAATVDVGEADSSDIAFLQYTSGSTGVPKGVALTHANLLANVRAMGKVVKASPDDVFVSWLPVYHDMGLIGAWFGSLYHAIPLVIMSPMVFLSRPIRWLQAIHRHRGTLSPAPNFAYELCINKIEERELEELDLSSWRLSWNGAEPVSPQTIQAFSDKFARFGFRPETMSPVYGLAECSVGLTFPANIRTPRIERFQREQLCHYGRAVQASEDDPNAIQLVGLGHPLPGHQIRIVDEFGRELPEGEEGALEFKGPSATQGYYREPEKTRALYHGDWLVTGDRAFTLGGELFLTGRSKDIIIRAGRNIYPHELEGAVSSIAGIRKGCVAVFGCHDSRSGTERLVVLAESHITDEKTLIQLREQINNLALDLLGNPADKVVISAPHTIPKTSSGKIRRTACKALYEQGELKVRHRAVWLQALHLAISGIRPQLRRYWRTTLDIGYAAYMWLVMGVLAPVIWLLVAVVPDKRWCWRVIRIGARVLIRLTGTKLTVQGSENQPDANTPCILVANHSSYLDGVALIAATEFRYRFVAKIELLKNPFARIFLSRLGTEFVERFDVKKGVIDARRVVGCAKACQQEGSQQKNGYQLLIFPEGAFFRMAGLHEFRMGAFIAAAEAGLPVIPVTLRGTRSKLRGDSLFPRRGDISVTIGRPLYPQGTDWNAAIVLRDQARNEILHHCGEPDLAHHPTEPRVAGKIE